MKNFFSIVVLVIFFLPRKAFTLCSFTSSRLSSWSFGGTLMTVGWTILIVGLVYLLVRSAGERRVPDDDPLKILKKRYARGEIGQEEYERIKRDLTG